MGPFKLLGLLSQLVDAHCDLVCTRREQWIMGPSDYRRITVYITVTRDLVDPGPREPGTSWTRDLVGGYRGAER